MSAVIRVLRDLVLLVVRVIVAGILLVHGYRRYQLGTHQLTQLVADLGLPAPEVFAWGTLVFELLGGLLLLFGLATPVIGAVLVAEQVMVIAWSRWPHGLLNHEGGFEYNLALAALGLVLFAFGAGRTGLDALFTNREPDRERRLIVDADPA